MATFAQLNPTYNAVGGTVDTSTGFLNPTTANAPVDFSTLNNYNPQTGAITPKSSAPSGSSTFGSGNSAPQNQYAVVTSGAATQNYNNINQDYSQNIVPKIQNSQNNQQAQSTLPVIAGYNVSANPTGNAGETKATNNATGQSYYITPQKPGLSATDVQGMLTFSAPSSASSGTSNTSPTAPQTPSQQAQQQTGVNPTTENQTYQSQISQVNDDITNAYSAFQKTINSIMSGSFPLTGAQQSLVNATNQAFDQMTTQANLKAAALSSETGGVADKVNATAGELTNINSAQAAAVAKLELGFQQQNYQMVTDSYNEYKDLETTRLNSITSLHNSVMDTYNKAVTADQAQQTFNQTVYKDAATLAQGKYEFRDLKDAFGNTVGTQVYDKATGAPVSNNYAAGQTDPTTGVTTPVVTTDPNTGTVDQVSQQAYLQTIPSAYRDLVQGIVNGKIEPPSARTAKGAQILSWVAGADPTLSDGSGGFDSTKYAARLAMQKSLASYSSGSYGSAVVSANKVISHLASFLNSSSQLPNAAVNPFNVNKLASDVAGGIGALVGQTGIQSSQAQAEQEARGLTDEMTKFFKGTGGTDVNSLESWGSSLNPNASAGTQKGIVQGTLNLFSGQLNSFIQQYTSVMGKAPDLGTVIQPQTMQTLSAFKNAGYQVDIPGVYYTDKSAWQNNGGTQNQWNSAVDTLTTHGIPLTQENILQAAQVMNE